MEKYDLNSNTVFNYLKDVNWYGMGLLPVIEMPDEDVKIAVLAVKNPRLEEPKDDVWFLKAEVVLVANYVHYDWVKDVQIPLEFTPEVKRSMFGLPKVVIPETILHEIANPHDLKDSLKANLIDTTTGTPFEFSMGKESNAIYRKARGLRKNAPKERDVTGLTDKRFMQIGIPLGILEDIEKQKDSILFSTSRPRIHRYMSLRKKFDVVTKKFIKEHKGQKNYIAGELDRFPYFTEINPKEQNTYGIFITPMVAYVYTSKSKDNTQGEFKKIYDLNVQSNKEAIANLSRLPLEDINVYLHILKNMNLRSTLV